MTEDEQTAPSTRAKTEKVKRLRAQLQSHPDLSVAERAELLAYRRARWSDISAAFERTPCSELGTSTACRQGPRERPSAARSNAEEAARAIGCSRDFFDQHIGPDSAGETWPPEVRRDE
jgi:hypothetical protein